MLVCRTCLAKRDLCPLFGEKSAVKFTSILLLSATGIEIKENDGLSQAACKSCVKSIKDILHFKEICKRANEILQSFKVHIKIEDNGIYNDIINGNESNNQFLSDFEAYPEAFNPDNEEKVLNIHNIKTFNSSSKGDDNITLTNQKQVSKTITEFKTENIIEIEINSTNTDETVNKLTIEDLELSDLEGNPSTEYDDFNFDVNLSNNETLSRNTGRLSDISQSLKSLKTNDLKEIDKGKITFDIFKERHKVYMALAVKPHNRGSLECKKCHKVLINKHNFLAHAKTHFEPKYSCEACGKKFHSHNHMAYHQQRRHGRVKRLACPQCGFRAVDKTTLLNHVRLEHTGERPFICAECGDNFRMKRALRQHMHKHFGVNNQQCDRCPAMFKNSARLWIHQDRVHIMNYTYPCYLCSDVFKGGAAVKKHLLNAHGLPIDQQMKVKVVKIKRDEDSSNSSNSKAPSKSS